VLATCWLAIWVNVPPAPVTPVIKLVAIVPLAIKAISFEPEDNGEVYDAVNGVPPELGLLLDCKIDQD
jgi:hypothetical protein